MTSLLGWVFVLIIAMLPTLLIRGKAPRKIAAVNTHRLEPDEIADVAIGRAVRVGRASVAGYTVWSIGYGQFRVIAPDGRMSERDANSTHRAISIASHEAQNGYVTGL